MALLEVVAIVVTGIVSFFDLIVNIATLCFTGRCESDCCGVHFEHEEHPENSRTQRSDDESE